MPTLMVMAGGTGGHIYPGLAVADALRDRGWRVVWMGNPDGMEARIVPANGYEVAWVRFTALRGKGVLRKLLLPFNLLRGFAQALGQIRRVKPDVVLGMGGYITFPGGMMAALLGRPLVLHEQNSVAGLANRVLARVADRVLSGFPEVLEKAEWMGNPVRADIAAVLPPAERMAGREGPLRVLVVGGSLGAAVLNETVPQALLRLPAEQRPTVVHQAGERQIEALRAAYARVQVEGELRPFIDDMASAYAQADLVICRAGASTRFELCLLGKPALLIPLPSAVRNHQHLNAAALVRGNGADEGLQSELTARSIMRYVLNKKNDPLALARMAQAVKVLAVPDAAERVADALESVADAHDRPGA